VNIFKKLYKAIAPKALKNMIAGFRQRIADFRHRNREACWGSENPDKVFLLLQIIGKHIGLAAAMLIAIRNIMYAEKMGYIPIIDLMNVESQYHDKIAFGKDNAWEYYFDQPCIYGLQDISKSKNIIIFKNENKHKIDFFKWENIAFELMHFDKDLEGRILEYKKYFKQYIKFSKKMQEKMHKDYETILEGKEKVLGVVGRGAEFILRKPQNHRVVPEPSVLLEKTKEVFKQQKFNYIYLATEDCDVYQLFKEHFKEKLLDNGQRRVSFADVEKHDFLADVNFNYAERPKYNLGFDYLSSIYLLSKCNGILGSVVSATIVAYIMSDGYEYQYFFDLGVYS